MVHRRQWRRSNRGHARGFFLSPRPSLGPGSRQAGLPRGGNCSVLVKVQGCHIALSFSALLLSIALSLSLFLSLALPLAFPLFSYTRTSALFDGNACTLATSGLQDQTLKDLFSPWIRKSPSFYSCNAGRATPDICTNGQYWRLHVTGGDVFMPLNHSSNTKRLVLHVTFRRW